MLIITTTLEALHEHFAALPPKTLLGTALIERSAQGQPISRDQIADATTEIIQYNKRAQRMITTLLSLRPTIAAYDCPEYGL